MTKKEKYLIGAVAVLIVVVVALTISLLKGSKGPSSEAGNIVQSTSTATSSEVTTRTKPVQKPQTNVSSPSQTQNQSPYQPFVSHFTPSIGQFGQQVIAWGKNFQPSNTICIYKVTEKINCRIAITGYSKTGTDLPFNMNNQLIISGNYNVYITNSLGSSNVLPMTLFR